jgi:hypothetical protein
MVPNGKAIGRKIAVGDTTRIKLLLLYVPVFQKDLRPVRVYAHHVNFLLIISYNTRSTHNS